MHRRRTEIDPLDTVGIKSAVPTAYWGWGDLPVSARCDAAAARRFFRRGLSTLKVTPAEVVTDASAV
ncbi:hypothetical protein [Catellatospora paridis]|uniref:hypothetical protein n=1 Tax=Catellatospora paridis TaxID=1617086 RepID=UPI001E30224F|nr:hypothetical protein [Catellatospora paridis]